MVMKEQNLRARRATWMPMLGLCVVAGTIQAELCQYMQASDDYQKPYFILWYAHSYFSFLLPIYAIFRFFSDGFSWSALKHDFAFGLAQIFSPSSQATSLSLLRTNFSRMLRCCAWMVVPLTAATYFWYLAAALTTPSRLASAANTACFFAYLFEVYFFRHPWNSRTIFAVLVGVLGVAVMSGLSAREAPIGIDAAHPDRIGNPWRLAAGDLSGLISAALTGLFENVYKMYLVPKHTGNSLPMSVLITAILGVFTFSLMWIPIPIFHLLGWETFALPPANVFKQMSINACLSALYNLGLLVVISQAGPVTASVGVMLGIPAVALADVVFMNRGLGIGVILGGSMVMIAFALLVFQQSALDSSHIKQKAAFAPLESIHVEDAEEELNGRGIPAEDDEYTLNDFEREYGDDDRPPISPRP